MTQKWHGCGTLLARLGTGYKACGRDFGLIVPKTQIDIIVWHDYAIRSHKYAFAKTSSKEFGGVKELFLLFDLLDEGDVETLDVAQNNSLARFLIPRLGVEVVLDFGFGESVAMTGIDFTTHHLENILR